MTMTKTMTETPKVRTCLWFDDNALAAARFYCALLPDCQIHNVERQPEGQDMAEPGEVLIVDFTLAGTPYRAINGGPHFKLDEAVSIYVATEDQAETDRLWEALTAGGGAESQCGWLKDRFGLSWQIVPKRAIKLMYVAKAAQVWPALMQMKRIDIAALEAAAEAPYADSTADDLRGILAGRGALKGSGDRGKLTRRWHPDS